MTRWLLPGLGFFLLTGLSLGQDSYQTEYVQGHRCLVVEPPDLSPEAPVILILHGYGTNADETLGISGEFQLPPCLLVLPDGPLPANHSDMVHAWYDRITHSRVDIERSRDYLFAVMDYFSREYAAPGEEGPPTRPRPVVIMGFSQGAVMSLEAGVNYRGNIAAIVCMNGYLGDPAKTLAHPAAPLHTPILLVHGTLDPIVQEEMVQTTLEALRRAGYRPFSRGFPVGHVMTAATIRAVSDFLGEILYNPRRE